jgi:hypothetical protein
MKENKKKKRKKKRRRSRSKVSKYESKKVFSDLLRRLLLRSTMEFSPSADSAGKLF